MGFSVRFRIGLWALLGVALLGASAGSMYGQGAPTTLVEPRAPLLPSKFGPWEPVGIKTGFDEIQPDEAIAAVLKEDGLDRASQETYYEPSVDPNTKDTIKVQAFQFVDATGAYSAFTYLRGPAMKDLPADKRIGKGTASTGGGDFLVLSGTTVVKATVSHVRPTTVDELKQLAAMLPKVGGPRGLSPLLPTYLPEKGLQADSVKYALGPVGFQTMGGVVPGEIVGFDKAAEVVMAKYSGRGMLTLVLYPTPQIAGEHGRAIEAEMNRQGSAAGTVKMRREGPLVLLTTGAWGAVEAKAMVEGIHLRNELTWNKAVPLEFHAEIQKTYSLLTSIAVFCGVGALAAVILGLFLGGGRAAIRVLQGKPAASEPEFLRIDLSGQAARIHSETPASGQQG
ncbi:MAG TPA: DUF6599 family protein [Edaphobacter sp.]|jgi:hypothetical protein|nr:DUF6599 family protein [Edaphobacter sp.]